MIETTLSQCIAVLVKESIKFKYQISGNFFIRYYFLGGENVCGYAVTTLK